MSLTLRDYQKEGVEFFRNSNGKCIFYHDTGVGKSFAALQCARLLLIKNPVARVLILTPASIVKQWHDEAIRYLGEMPAWLTITNYEKLLRDKTLRATTWTLIVADECQMIASPTAKRSKAFHKLKTTYKLAMSATPAPNALHELWSICHWLSPDVWHTSFWRFKQRECVLDYFGSIVGYHDEKRLRALIAPLIHRVTKDVLTELPDLNEQTIYIDAPVPFMRAYEDMRKTCRAELMGKRVTIPNAISLISRQRQFVDTPHSFGLQDSNPKLEYMYFRILRVSDKPTLIFVEHQETARGISANLSLAPVITGSTPMKQRNAIVAAFQAGENAHNICYPRRPNTLANFDVLIGTSALSTGLNIQRATRVINYSQYWNPARMDQACGRSYRMGQTSEVEHITLIVRGTIDEKIAALIKRKRKYESKFTREEILSLL